MKHLYLAIGIAFGFAPAAWADNVAHCEVLLVNTFDDDATNSQAQIASYRPAVGFIASVYDDAPEHLTHIDGHVIRALLCRRNNVIPTETDYPMIATGVPFIVSQNFDSSDTDSLTIYWKDGAFEHVYKGHPLSDESQHSLDSRLAAFTALGLQKNPKIEKIEE